MLYETRLLLLLYDEASRAFMYLHPCKNKHKSKIWYSLYTVRIECDEMIKPHIIKVKRKIAAI